MNMAALQKCLVKLLSGGAVHDLWILDSSIHALSLRFLDEKIEKSYQWHINRKYLVQNRYLCILMIAVASLLILYHWLVEQNVATFSPYLICDLISLVMMVFCAAFTFWSWREKYFVYRHLHVVMNVSLFLAFLPWIFGQPVILLVSNDKTLSMDPLQGFLLFVIFNIAMTCFRMSLISATLLLLVQLFTCCAGLFVRGQGGASIWQYLVNQFVAMVIAYIFALSAGREKELFIRRVFLVSFFQHEEAEIMQLSRIKLDILETGRKVLKHSKSVRSAWSHICTELSGEGEPSLPKSPSKHNVSSSSRNPSLKIGLKGEQGFSMAQHDIERPSLTPLLTYVVIPKLNRSKSMQNLNDEGLHDTPEASKSQCSTSSTEASSSTVGPNDDGDNSVAVVRIDQQPKCFSQLRSDQTGRQSYFRQSLNMINLNSIIDELPRWISSISQFVTQPPVAVRRPWFDKLKKTFKFRVQQHAGDDEQEAGFVDYFVPISLNRMSILCIFVMLSSFLSGIISVCQNKYTTHMLIIRFGYTPIICLAGVLLRRWPFVQTAYRSQLVITLLSLVMFWGPLQLVLNAHWVLRHTSQNEPILIPLPTTQSFSLMDSSYYSTPIFRVDPVVVSLPTEEETWRSGMSPQGFFTSSLNSLILIMTAVASSAGLRFSYYLLWSFLAFVSVTLSSIALGSMYGGFDGQLLRLELLSLFVLCAGAWMNRPIESSLRRWFHIKRNYRL